MNTNPNPSRVALVGASPLPPTDSKAVGIEPARQKVQVETKSGTRTVAVVGEAARHLGRRTGD